MLPKKRKQSFTCSFHNTLWIQRKSQIDAAYLYIAGMLKKNCVWSLTYSFHLKNVLSNDWHDRVALWLLPSEKSLQGQDMWQTDEKSNGQIPFAIGFCTDHQQDLVRALKRVQSTESTFLS